MAYQKGFLHQAGAQPQVVGYVRVSTDHQLENYSIDEQAQRISAYCQAKGWALLQIYTDGGFSGGNTERPALQRMLSAVKASPIDAVVVYKLDRLSRSQKDTLMLIEDELLSYDTDFISICENFDTSTPFGRAMIGILSVFAQLEKDQITERFTMGRIGRSKAGYYHGGGFIPFGYTYADGLLAVDEYRAAIVRAIFKGFLDGKSINSIWHEMQAAHGGKWSAAKVRKILTNTNYIGKVKFRGVTYDGVHQPIVSQEDFTLANQLLASSARNTGAGTAPKAPFRAETLLSGLVYCGRCGARYAGAHGFYKCYSRSKTSKRQVLDPACKNDNWRYEDLDRVVLDAVAALLNQTPLLASIWDAQPDEVAPDRTAIQKRLREIDVQLEKLVELYQVSAIPLDRLTRRATALDTEADALRQQLAEGSPIPPGKATATAGDRFLAGFRGAPTEAKRLLIRMLIQKIVLDGNSVRIEWRV